MTRAIRLLALLTACAAAPAAAQERFRLALPIDCAPGQDCFVQNYFDADPGPGMRDHACGPLSYDGHRGTDFRVSTIAALERGITVRAAAPGVVAARRDGMPDILQGWAGAPEIEGRDCGNGVVLRHEGGWETQYCHLAEGSVAVRRGERVETGAALGLVGLSGNTEFPHLHLSVRRDGVEIDPFDPEGSGGCEAARADTLWVEPPAYRAGALMEAGFAPALPDWPAIQSGTAAAEVAADAPMVLWAYLFGARKGDVVRLTVTGPGGRVFLRDMPLMRTLAQSFRAAGLEPPEGGWPAGDYAGEVTLWRDGAALHALEVPLRMAAR
ncbi:M23 family metallopeptidase [Limimaricola pyoseonensis]|uniref:Peptidase family M23 n=1 Tax=Limimaricola pyoseonensis TaxID=521013 RepID=A0A1G7CF47_9RHOB|nr:M23 family metallopeptidase [Limimaricola pyoseonensis]SDE37968.1 Peptidase family M23 [Limimaricola pyoseonensis]